MPSCEKKNKKILLLGSGGLSIGQAGEFDYSGTQAVRAFKEEGWQVVLINPNIATVQTSPDPQVSVYLYPLSFEWISKVIAKERPFAVVGSFGGQTALNCLLELEEKKILEKYKVKNLGTSVQTLRLTEDRELFAKTLKELKLPVAPSIACQSLKESFSAARKISYPVIVRAAYTLGGLGSGFANSDEELESIVAKALSMSPQVLIEKSLKGWKELEYEVMRDRNDNCITICNMENFDPLGIHTGDSIVVCPSQSLTDDEYQKLRLASLKMVKHLKVIGECNAQFALCPKTSEFYVIEVNARLSRSSALASKASGYPIAYIAAKVVLGHSLPELKNPVTQITSAFYEPALDYVTVKFPRWDLSKFQGVSRQLGSTMKSVGEVMAIGRNFPEALQKAVRMVKEESLGLYSQHEVFDLAKEKLFSALEHATDERLGFVMQALRMGLQLGEVYEKSQIDLWFLAELKKIITCEEEIIKNLRHEKDFTKVEERTWRQWKKLGFSDEQIAFLSLQENLSKWHTPKAEDLNSTTLLVRQKRKELGVRAYSKKIDTTAAEYPSPSNYFYFSYDAQFDEPRQEDKRPAVLILGGGTYRIGASVEFDWCAVSASRSVQKLGARSIMLNCNPETVSTDYLNSDVLYFEELSLERILDISEQENTRQVIVSMGGQLPNKLALSLAQEGFELLGHSAETIDMAEDRYKFSSLCDQLSIMQPSWVSANSKKAISEFVKTYDFPLIVRPSYVLSGAAMAVAYDEASLERALGKAHELSKKHPVVLSKFHSGAREVEVDGVAENGKIILNVVSEHVENAGTHSGDATSVIPAQRLYVETVRQIKKASRLIASGLKLNGPFNMQFLAEDNKVRVIECNARAARSFPFVSKVIGINLAEVATAVMLKAPFKIPRYSEDELTHVGVKAAMFSFARLKGADPVSGVEMSSTGEVGCLASCFSKAFLLALEATHVRKPRQGVLVSAGTKKDKLKFLAAAKVFQKLGLKLYATKGTALFLEKEGIKAKSVNWPDEKENNVLDLIRSGQIDLVCNIPKNLSQTELSFGMQIRQESVAFGISLLSNMEKVLAFTQSLELEALESSTELKTLQPYSIALS